MSTSRGRTQNTAASKPLDQFATAGHSGVISSRSGAGNTSSAINTGKAKHAPRQQDASEQSNGRDQELRLLQKISLAGGGSKDELTFIFHAFSEGPDNTMPECLTPEGLQKLLQAEFWVVHTAKSKGHGIVERLPDGFAENLFEAWSDGLEYLNEKSFVAGFKVYLAQNGAWLKQWKKAVLPEESQDPEATQLAEASAELPKLPGLQNRERDLQKDDEFPASEDELQHQVEKMPEPPPEMLLLQNLGAVLSQDGSALKLFQHFDTNGRNGWSVQDVSEFCTSLWQVDGRSPPPYAFSLPAFKKVRALAREAGYKKSKDAEVGLLSLEEVKLGLSGWIDIRHAHFRSWAKARYSEVYGCPCCRGRFQLVQSAPADGITGGRAREIAKAVMESGVLPGAVAIPRAKAAGALGSAGSLLPLHAEVASIHDATCKAFASGSTTAALPPGSARPALAGRLLLEAAAAAPGRGVACQVMLLAEESELKAVNLWLASAAPNQRVVNLSHNVSNGFWPCPGGVAGREFPSLLLVTPQRFRGLVKARLADPKDVDYVVCICSAEEVPPLREISDCEEHLSLFSSKPCVKCLLDSSSELHQALVSHLDAVGQAKGHFQQALRHLEIANTQAARSGMEDLPPVSAESAILDMLQLVDRYPTPFSTAHTFAQHGARVAVGGAAGTSKKSDAKPLGYDGPLEAIRSYAPPLDDVESEDSFSYEPEHEDQKGDSEPNMYTTQSWSLGRKGKEAVSTAIAPTAIAPTAIAPTAPAVQSSGFF
eukprot:TRINITY_DN95335_c0_g1_i1.p1 TRINITY_DN95335_c0_g1~~TRINITY_DN95335_c0_g1_i1.p1  ORF type:complete len:767 (+),score=187.53 TRINITY_DN95335_c0_g1_i1:51-2351(+)